MTAVIHYNVNCALYHRYNLYHLGGILTALCELGVQREINVNFLPLDSGFSGNEITLWMQVTQTSKGNKQHIAIEVGDRSDRFCMPALESCDLYFKRSYYESHLNSLPQNLRVKIRPFGLNYASRNTGHPVINLIFRKYLAALFKNPLDGLRDLSDDIGSFRNFIDTPKLKNMEQTPEQPLEHIVFFQTRLFDQTDIGSDIAEEVNGQRIELIRFLKSELGHLFRGGLLPTDLALRHHRNLVTKESCGRRDYIELSKRALIGIYTRGIHHSLAFKLGEYLASAKCIVSEPLRNSLPVPLLSGRHFLSFETPQECVEHCVRLLQDSVLASEMRWNNWHYYEQEVRPTAHMLNCFDRAFAG